MIVDLEHYTILAYVHLPSISVILLVSEEALDMEEIVLISWSPVVVVVSILSSGAASLDSAAGGTARLPMAFACSNTPTCQPAN